MPELEAEEEPRKAQFDLEDKLTECCGAKFYEETDLCSDCKEHADVAEEEHEVAPIIKAIFKEKEDELIHKRMNDINTFQAHENEVYLRGTDEYGKDFQICFDSYNFLEWIDTEHLEYIKEKLKKYIESK